jgi:putative transposase
MEFFELYCKCACSLRLVDVCLNINYFTSLSEARKIIESWRLDYNETRPQKGLKELTPSQFKTKLKGMKNSS